MSTTPRTTVVVGGTAGLGLGIALARLHAGDVVTVVGRDPRRGDSFLRTAADVGAAGRAAFLAGDVRTIAGSRAIAAGIRERHDRLDALVLSAYAPQLRRRITEDGVETSMAMYYLARRVLGEELGPLLDAAPEPVIVSLNGVGAVRGTIRWDDLTLERRYRVLEATMQAGRAAELLAVAHATATPPRRARYVLFHPGYTRTPATGLPWPARAAAAVLAIAAQPVERAIRPLLEVLERPPAAPLSAIDRGRPVPLESFADQAAARRLEQVFTPLLAVTAP